MQACIVHLIRYILDSAAWTSIVSWPKHQPDLQALNAETAEQALSVVEMNI